MPNSSAATANRLSRVQSRAELSLAAAIRITSFHCNQHPWSLRISSIFKISENVASLAQGSFNRNCRIPARSRRLPTITSPITHRHVNTLSFLINSLSSGSGWRRKSIQTFVSTRTFGALSFIGIVQHGFWKRLPAVAWCPFKVFQVGHRALQGQEPLGNHFFDKLVQGVSNQFRFLGNAR